MNRDSIIARCNTIHNNNNRFSYILEDINYMSKDKITIICPEHGQFQQRLSNHLAGQGCKSCMYVKNSSNLEKFIISATKRHGEKYDYTNSIYNGSHEKINITCRIHGEFLQTANDHLSGHGCIKCLKDSTLQRILNKAIEVHKGVYDYSTTRLEGINLVNIICKAHGVFSQNKSNHLKGSGCAKCGIQSLSKPRKTSDVVFAECAQKHNYKYDYSSNDIDQEFKSETKIKIICPYHGQFFQSIRNHKFGQGCPKCNNGGRYNNDFFSNEHNRKICGKLYLIKLNNEDSIYKIGITKRKLNQRFRDLDYDVLYTLDGNIHRLYLTEQHFLNTQLYKKRKVPATRFGGDRECFTMDQNLIENLKTDIHTYYNSLIDSG